MKHAKPCVVLALALLLPSVGWADEQQPLTLQQLLEQVKNADAADAKVNAEREARFATARDEQQKLVNEADAEKKKLEAESNALIKQFEANDQEIAQLAQKRDVKAGNLGELFGVMRQVAGDFATVARNSMLTTQFPDRVAQIDRLAQTKTMPPIEDLNRFWFEMMREMTESGEVVQVKTKVVATDGAVTEAQVLRVGPFVAIQDGQFLEYGSSTASFSVPPKQPSSNFRSIAAKFEDSNEGYARMVVDPTRGVLLSLFSLRPSWIDRIKLGEAVGYVIITVGVIGAILAAYQFFFLATTTLKVREQLRDLGRLRDDNPLGRVLLAFKGEAAPKAGEQADVVELRLSEAVLRELPAIERIQSFLKLAVAAGPLLGLIGTVIGMIHTFQSITESGSGDPKLMAAGIGQAMIATVLGLGIAIPLLFANSLLATRSKRIIQILDEQSTGLLAEFLERRVHG